MSKPLVIGTIVAVVGIFALGGFLLWQWLPDLIYTYPGEPDGQTPSYVPVTETEVDVLDTSDWQIYRNDEFGFEVRYPEGWEATKLAATEGIGFFITDTERGFMYIAMIEREKGDTIEDTLKKHTSLGETGLSVKQLEEIQGRVYVESFEVKNIGDNQFYYLNDYLFEGDYGVVYFIEDKTNDKFFKFELFSPTQSDKNWTDPEYDVSEEPNHTLLKQILSTFRFVE